MARTLTWTRYVSTPTTYQCEVQRIFHMISVALDLIPVCDTGVHYRPPSTVYSPQAPGCDEQLSGPQGHSPLPLRRAVLALLIRWGGAAAQRCHGSGCHGSGSGKVELFNPSILSFSHIPIPNFNCSFPFPILAGTVQEQ